MSRNERIQCECGGKLTRPIPKTCPHCGKEIVAIKRRVWPAVLQVVAIIALFASLVLFVWFVVEQQ